MIRKFLTSLDWNQAIKQCANNPQYKKVIELFLKPDLIYSVKFENNFKIANASWETMLIHDREFSQIKITPTMNFFKDSLNRPLGLASWFIAAYPDVSKWASENLVHIQNVPPFRGHFENEEDYLENNEFKYHILRLMIDYYKKNINKKLECHLD